MWLSVLDVAKRTRIDKAFAAVLNDLTAPRAQLIRFDPM
jgi:hypothetical protein